MERRDFIKACAAGCALGAQDVFSAQDLKPRQYARTQLVDDAGQPLRASRLVVDRNYIFHYPFESTPCFLLNLGRPTGRNVALRTEDGSAYTWPGGVGPGRSIVGFSAICTHRMTYPTQQVSFIGYRDKSSATAAAKANHIHCCSEHSAYDPASGARVVSGPAPQPLCAILLDYDAKTDSLYATGTLGGEIFDAFFSRFEFKLAMEPGGNRAKEKVAGRAVVRDIQKFCRNEIRC